MANLGAFTTTGRVRTAFGVDEADCPDKMLVESTLVDELETHLNDWLPTYASLLAAGNEASATTDARRLSVMIQLYSTFWIAVELANKPLLVPTLFSNGKDRLQRRDITTEEVVRPLRAKVAEYRAKILTAMGETVSVTRPSLLVVATPDSDPVTTGIQ